MKKTSLFCIVMLLLSTNSILRAQDSLPRIIIGDLSIYESTDSIVGEGIQGYVSYDAPTNTLFLNNASTPFIWAYRSERCLKIKLIGNNSITKILTTNDSCAFFGPGTLNLGNSSVEIALDCSRTDYLALTEGATLNITASGAGIFSLYDYTMDSDSILHFPSLIIDNSSLVITAPYCCQFIWDWWLSDCHVVAPQDFEYQLDTWTFLPSGMVSDYLEIRPGTVGVSEFPTATLTVYPNPTDDLLFVELRGAGIANVALYDLQGRAVETLRATSLQNGTAALDVKSLPAGVYVLRVKDTDGREYQQKVVRR